MSASKKLVSSLAGIQTGGEGAEGVSFDGTNDYLYSGIPTGSPSGSKELTLSFWIYRTEGEGFAFMQGTSGSSPKIDFSIQGSGRLVFSLRNSSGSNVLDSYMSGSSQLVPSNTWSHVLISVNLATLTAHSYINDSAVNTTLYTILNQDFASSSGNVCRINNNTNANSERMCRLANFFFDYTYRNLSIEANRRLFITEDGKPAEDQTSLSPILYLPMTDADTAGVNEGTGGDFTVNGTLDTAQRGANQDNCVASEFDGKNDYLSSTGIGASDGKQCTISFIIKADDLSETVRLFTQSVSSFYPPLDINLSSNGNLIMNSNGGYITSFQTNNGYIIAMKEYLITYSFDLTNPANRHVFINGVDVTLDIQINNYSNQNMLFQTNSTEWFIGGRATDGKFDGSLGELYFDTNYIDLSTDNPFWDADANRPKPVRQVLEETGNTPLIAMPISADNPTKNYGTGGDFTLNGGGLTGARGGSEYWSRSAYLFDDSVGYLRRDTSNISDTKKISIAMFRKGVGSTGGNNNLITFNDEAGEFNGLAFIYLSTEGFRLRGYNSSGTEVLYLNTPSSLVTDKAWHSLLISADLETGDTAFYIDNSPVSLIEDTLLNDTIDLTRGFMRVGSASFGSDAFGWLSNVYCTTDYIDFSQEANRNLFVDQLGYPKDLTPAIDNGDIPTPLVYMKFDDPDNLGTNSGTGGDFTVNGTVTQGSDVDPNA